MAGKLGIVFLLVIAFSFDRVIAQQSAGNSSPSASGSPTGTATPAKLNPPVPSRAPDDDAKRKDEEARKKAEFEIFRRVLEQMSPEQRQKFSENLKVWQSLPQDEKRYLKEQDSFRQGRIAQEIEQSIRQSGLQLDADRKEVYALRYAQERRKIEERLHHEMEMKRRPLLEEMGRRLKEEFSIPLPGTTPTPAPVESPKPASTPTSTATPTPKPTSTPPPANPPRPAPSATISPSLTPTPTPTVKPQA